MTEKDDQARYAPASAIAPENPTNAPTTESSAEWVEDCLKWRGKVLTGVYAHWCFEFDDLPVDETCFGEWPCGCSIKMPDGTIVDTMEVAREAIAKAEGR